MEKPDFNPVWNSKYKSLTSKDNNIEFLFCINSLILNYFKLKIIKYTNVNTN